MNHRRWAAGAVVVATVALLVGVLAASAASGFLAIRVEDKQLPVETPTEVAGTPVLAIAPLGEVDLAGAERTLPVAKAVDALTRAAADRQHSGVAVTVRARVGTAADAEGFTLTRSGTTVTVAADGPRGLVQGLYRLASGLNGGASWKDLATGEKSSPRLSQRFVDTGAVGVTPDPEAYRAQDDYKHSSGALEDVVLSEAPWVDADGLRRATSDWQAFIDHAAAYGYNGVLVPGFLEYVNFDAVGDGFQIYPVDSPYRARHVAMRQQVGEMWRYAHRMGMSVVFKTDMLALTPPLREYLERELGGLDATNPRLWDVYRAGIDELLGEMGFIDGLMIRIGEGGGIYHHHGWDYSSALEVTEPAAVQAMLAAATQAAAAHGDTIWFRTWSVGVGSVGNMHTNPDTYARVLDAVEADNLVVSTKFVAGDFDSFLPLNPTLATGKHRRMVELQGRREFEAFSAFPNDMGPQHQTALRQLLAANPRIDGVWVWTQDGGPWRAGPMSLYLKSGFWRAYDLNVWTASRLAWDSEADLGAATREWLVANCSDDPATVAALGEVLGLSRAAVLEGLYVRPYAEHQVFALGLEPPPMMWIFKWDLVSGDTAALSAVYLGSRDDVDGAVEQGRRAEATAGRMAALLAKVSRESFHDPAQYDLWATSVAYETDVLATLAAYRTVFLRYYQWLDTGDGSAHDAWRDAVGQYRERVAAHDQAWRGNLDFPPFEFGAANLGIRHAERAEWGRPLAAAVAALLLAGVMVVGPLRRGAFTPWAAQRPTASWQRWATWLLPAVAVVAVPMVASGALSWIHAAAVAGCWALWAAAVLAAGRSLSAALALAPVVAAQAALQMLWWAAALAWRGPVGAWFSFWTDPGPRSVWLAGAVALLVWGAAAVAMAVGARAGWLAAVSTPVLAVGVPLLMLGLVMALVGVEASLTAWNNQVAVLPLGLSRILGLTVHLGIPMSLGWWVAGVGCAAVALGAAGVAGGRRAALT